MTELLKQALSEVEKLPEIEQDGIAAIILEELADEKRWQEKYSLPPKEDVPDWHSMLQKPDTTPVTVEKSGAGRTAVAGSLLGTALALLLFYLGLRKRR